MTRTENDLREMYYDLADTAIEAGADVRPKWSTAEPVRRAGMSGRTRRIVIPALAAAAALVAALLVPVGGRMFGPATASANPVTVLRQAAAATAKQPTLTPRPDQYYYIKMAGSEMWLSMDGTHDGLRLTPGEAPIRLQGCRGWTSTQPVDGVYNYPPGCPADPAYIPGLPTTAGGMVGYLEHRYGDAGANGIGKGAMALLEFHYVPPAARAAVFEALTQLPGLKAVELADSGGHKTIGVIWSSTGPQNIPAKGEESATLVFDKVTHEYLGARTTGVNGEPGSGDAPSQWAITDRVGQRP